MTFCHSHRSVSCWAIIRDASFRSRWVLLTQRYSTGQCTNIDFETWSLKCYVFIKTLRSGFSELSGRGSRKITRAREDEQHQGNSVFPTTFVCTDACENSPRLWQACTDTSTETAHAFPSLTKTLSPIDFYWQRKIYISPSKSSQVY